jgi:hypothetical protein
LFSVLAAHFSVAAYWLGLFHRISPFEYSGTALLAFLMGWWLWRPANSLFKWTVEGEVERAIYEKNDPLEVLLKESMRDGRAVLVTLQSGKVYVGQVIANFNPAYDVESIKISPILSGYRRADDQSVAFNIDYTDLLTKVHNHDPDVSPRDKEDLGIVITLDEVTSACIFSLPMYRKFFAQHIQHSSR